MITDSEARALVHLFVQRPDARMQTNALLCAYIHQHAREDWRAVVEWPWEWAAYYMKGAKDEIQIPGDGEATEKNTVSSPN